MSSSPHKHSPSRSSPLSSEQQVDAAREEPERPSKRRRDNQSLLRDALTLLTGAEVGTEPAHEKARRGSHEIVFDSCVQDITASARSIDNSLKLLRATWIHKAAELADVKDELERTKRELNEKVQAVAEAEASAHKAFAELETAQLEAKRRSTALAVSAVEVQRSKDHRSRPKIKMSKQARKEELQRIAHGLKAVRKLIASNLAEIEATRVRWRAADAARRAAGAVPPRMR